MKDENEKNEKIKNQAFFIFQIILLTEITYYM